MALDISGLLVSNAQNTATSSLLKTLQSGSQIGAMLKSITSKPTGEAVLQLSVAGQSLDLQASPEAAAKLTAGGSVILQMTQGDSGPQLIIRPMTAHPGTEASPQSQVSIATQSSGSETPVTRGSAEPAPQTYTQRGTSPAQQATQGATSPQGQTPSAGQSGQGIPTFVQVNSGSLPSGNTGGEALPRTVLPGGTQPAQQTSGTAGSQLASQSTSGMPTQVGAEAGAQSASQSSSNAQVGQSGQTVSPAPTGSGGGGGPIGQSTLQGPGQNGQANMQMSAQPVTQAPAVNETANGPNAPTAQAGQSTSLAAGANSGNGSLAQPTSQAAGPVPQAAAQSSTRPASQTPSGAPAQVMTDGAAQTTASGQNGRIWQSPTSANMTRTTGAMTETSGGERAVTQGSQVSSQQASSPSVPQAAPNAPAPGATSQNMPGIQAQQSVVLLNKADSAGKDKAIKAETPNVYTASAQSTDRAQTTGSSGTSTPLDNLVSLQRNTMSQQGSMTDLFANLQSFLGQMEAGQRPEISKDVETVMRWVMGFQLPTEGTDNSKQAGDALRQIFASLGLMGNSQGETADALIATNFKATLTLLQAMLPESKASQTPTSQQSASDQPPLRGAPLQGQDARPSTILPSDSDEAALSQIRRNVEAALARATLSQIASLRSSSPENSPHTSHGLPVMHAEVPVALANGTAMIQMTIQQELEDEDEEAQEKDGKKRKRGANWSVNFALDAAPVGAVDAGIRLREEKISLTLSAERQETLAFFKQSAPMLQSMLEEVGLSLEGLIVNSKQSEADIVRRAFMPVFQGHLDRTL
ncbi:flagellar hook-length control protein FliK [uncultured Cohaesibacter sp.]|uniref:flagellar hook-length control protein FliK n=1 Tax=uncultured Cohaesibacter sp. TaxID=1002546 RepID=UPI00292E921B|nr:flagellar hook-length control protein FliK [uncultured Cohaesibacter sp.]